MSEDSGREEEEEMQITELKQECAFVDFGNLCDSQGRYDEALEAYDRPLGIVPDDADVLFDKGETLVKVGRGDEAVGYFARAMALYVGA